MVRWVDSGFREENLSTDPTELVSNIWNPPPTARALGSIAGGLSLVNSSGWVGSNEWMDTPSLNPTKRFKNFLINPLWYHVKFCDNVKKKRDEWKHMIVYRVKLCGLNPLDKCPSGYIFSFAFLNNTLQWNPHL